LIFAKFGKDLFNRTYKIKGHKTKWHRFLAYPVYSMLYVVVR